MASTPVQTQCSLAHATRLPPAQGHTAHRFYHTHLDHRDEDRVVRFANAHVSIVLPEPFKRHRQRTRRRAVASSLARSVDEELAEVVFHLTQARHSGGGAVCVSSNDKKKTCNKLPLDQQLLSLLYSA